MLAKGDVGVATSLLETTYLYEYCCGDLHDIALLKYPVGWQGYPWLCLDFPHSP